MNISATPRRLSIANNTTNLPGILDIVSILILVIPAVLITLANLGDTYDDAFITYRYAYNLATGNGFVYNIGERFLGTTAPLYGVILGLLGVVNPDAIPLISAGISGLSLALTGIALYVFGRLHQQPFCGLLAGLFFVLNPLVHLTIGGEMLFQVALIMWAFVLYSSGRTVLSAGLLGVAILARPDAVVATGVIGLHYVVTQRRIPWRELLCLFAVLAPFMVVSELYYGSLLPGTLSAKQAQRASGFWSPFLRTSFEWISSFTVQGSSSLFAGISALPHATRFIYFTLLGVPAVLFLFRFWLLPLVWVILYVVGYHLLDVPFYHWYVVPIVIGLMVLAASGVAGVVELSVRILKRLSPKFHFPLTPALLSVLAFLILVPGLVSYVPWQPRISFQTLAPVEKQYVDMAKWFKDNTAPDATIGYLEIGFLGYYSQRPIVDQLGLVNAGVAEHIANGEWLWAYEHLRPDYVVYNQRFGHLGQAQSEPWFKQAYTEVGQMTAEGADTLVIYKRLAPTQP